MNNALKYVRLLESTGVAREQAEAQVQIFSEMMEDDLATKQDLKNLETKFETSLKNLDSKIDTSVRNLETKIDAVAERFDHKMLQMEYRLTIKLGTIVTAVIAIATTIIKFV